MLLKTRTFILLLAILLAVPIIPLAQEITKDKEKKAVEIEEIVVTAPSLKSTQDVISRDSIEQVRTGQTVESVLETVPGIVLKRKSFSDSGNKISLRGFDESRCLIMLDGRPLNGAGVYGGKYVDWASLSLDDIEEVQIIRGAHLAKYGNTLGGVINVVTRPENPELQNKISMVAGAFNTQQYQLFHGFGTGPLIWSVSASDYKTYGSLRNNFVDRDNLALHLTDQIDSHTTLSLRTTHTINENGFIAYNKPDSAYYDRRYPDADEETLGGPYVGFKGGASYWGNGSYWKDIRDRHDLSLTKELDKLVLVFNAYLIEEKRTEYFYAIDNKDKLIMQRYSEPEDNNWGWSLSAQKYQVNQHILEMGLEGNYLGYGGMKYKYADTTYLQGWFQTTNYDGQKDSTRNAIYLQDKWDFNPQLVIDLGLRLEDYEGRADTKKLDDTGVGPKIGATYNAWSQGQLGLHISKAYRFPTNPESYWWEAGYQPANRRTLAPEDALIYDLEVNQKIKNLHDLTLRLYYYNVEDYIRTIFGYKPSRVVYNIDDVKLSGVEFGSVLNLPYRFSALANYTYQKTKKSGDILDLSNSLSKELTELPRHQANVGLQYKSASDAVLKGVLRYVGEKDIITGNLTQAGASQLQHIDGFTTIGFSAEYPIARNKKNEITSRLKIGIENLTGENYEESYGFPMPGRTITVGTDLLF